MRTTLCSRAGDLKLGIKQERKELIANRLVITGWKPREDIIASIIDKLRVYYVCLDTTPAIARAACP